MTLKKHWWSSCRPKDLPRAKYELQYSQRSHYGADDSAFGCMGVKEDEQGKLGVYLKKDVVSVAQKCLSQHIRKVAPHILPLSELVSHQLVESVSGGTDDWHASFIRRGSRYKINMAPAHTSLYTLRQSCCFGGFAVMQQGP